MINKKLIILPFLMLFAFLAAYNYADGKNFVTILNGANFKSSGNENSYSFIGQPVVFTTKENKDSISQSAFASVFYATQSSSITFTNNTDTEPFEDVNIPLNVTINSVNNKKITKIRYQIWQGENADWNDRTTSPEKDYTGFTSGTSVEFKETVAFNKGESVNSFRVYAQLEDDSKRWSDAYTVRISSGISGAIEIVSPDKVSKIASTDPHIETTKYSIDFTTATIILYEGSVGGTIVSSVTVSASSNTYGLYDIKSKKISFKYSDFAKEAKIPTTLKNNKKYTLVIESKNNSSETPETDSVEFTALSGGIADILTYPSPFNPNKEKIKIKYVLAKDAKVTIRFYDKAGKLVCRLLQDEQRSAGTNEEEWDGRNYAGSTLATGAYIVEIIANGDRRYTALAIVGK